MKLSFALASLCAGVALAQAPDAVVNTVLDACGLPTNYQQTSHCFRDVTHHTCCMLGPQARAYADASGNPIGTAASDAFVAKHGRAPTDADATPWCTCFGSLVCSYYASKFNDGTHIKFIYEPASNPPQGAFNIPASEHCEAKAREFFQVLSHGTPGVFPKGDPLQCPQYNVESNVKQVA